ncbi:hypothetical protein GCK72_022723 [Caenorhabditis remanei]|uniref:Uncharacterized protein n=1 Tax=Caenorhabditis remanei TaxID=31234 RepID=A0A6A5FUG3_CAERE|nr:hypothetical protein GCK72_022723 [Caenorhabditis remanei]KAF1746270.1 hypothetical protein GCK72_022723 [Caenorhabditis remanei]
MTDNLDREFTDNPMPLPPQGPPAAQIHRARADRAAQFPVGHDGRPAGHAVRQESNPKLCEFIEIEANSMVDDSRRKRSGRYDNNMEMSQNHMQQMRAGTYASQLPAHIQQQKASEPDDGLNPPLHPRGRPRGTTAAQQRTARFENGLELHHIELPVATELCHHEKCNSKSPIAKIGSNATPTTTIPTKPSHSTAQQVILEVNGDVAMSNAMKRQPGEGNCIFMYDGLKKRTAGEDKSSGQELVFPVDNCLTNRQTHASFFIESIPTSAEGSSAPTTPSTIATSTSPALSEQVSAPINMKPVKEQCHQINRERVKQEKRKKKSEQGKGKETSGGSQKVEDSGGKTDCRRKWNT